MLPPPTRNETMSEDLSAFTEAQVPPSGDVLAQLVAQANELVNLDKQIEDLEGLLKKLNGRAHELKTVVLPAQMAKVGQSSFTLTNGFQVEIEDFISVATPPKDKAKKEAMRTKRIAALTKMEGGEALVKTDVSIQFEKKQHNQALALVDDLRKKGFIVDVASDVNSASLKAFVREKLRAGEKVDQDALGLFLGLIAKVTKPEGK